jgi:hypothetical protein
MSTKHTIGWYYLHQNGSLILQARTRRYRSGPSRKWRCNDADAPIYAERVGCRLERDGNQWHACRFDFVNIQESPSGFGSTCLEAMAELCKGLGFKASKMWGQTFSGLLKVTAS